MKVSYSSLSCFNDCPYKYKLRYLDKLETKFDERPDNPLVLGTAIHEGIETGDIDKAINTYKENYSIFDENNEWEILKLKSILPIAIRDIPKGEYEHRLNIDNEFVGFIDLLVKVDEGVYDLYDFKYSNNISRYLKSPQIHIYKYYFERITGNVIRNMYYVFIPKNTKKFPAILTEEIKNKLISEINNDSIRFEKVDYDKRHIKHFFSRKSILEKTEEFNKRYSTKCSYCEYQKYCRTRGQDTSELTESSLLKLDNKL